MHFLQWDETYFKIFANKNEFQAKNTKKLAKNHKSGGPE